MTIFLKENSKFPESIHGIPQNYNFEIQKTLKTIEKLEAKRIAMQFPDGLLCYAPLLIDTIQTYFKDTECIVLDDVVYGACCIDDQCLTVDLLIHYGHSCLVPISEMNTRVLYIFVDIKIDLNHLYKMIINNFKEKIAVIGTIQFNSSVNKLKRMIENQNDLVIPQVKPLSPGEVLGCTSPIIKGVNTVIYIGDGRFHLESAMIRNPNLNFYKYCPFTRKLSQEFYDNQKMLSFRNLEIKRAFEGKNIGVILGSLGRQGNKQIFKNVVEKLESLKKYKIYKIVLEEINQELLDHFEFIDAFVQVSCPRLSIDWGVCYRKPLLSPFEIFYNGGEYEMDYYSKEGNSPWRNYNNIISHEKD